MFDQTISFIPGLKDFATKTHSVWVKNLRTEGLARLNKLGIPTTRDEEWKYTDLTPLKERKFAIPADHRLKEADQLKNYINTQDINLVFVNGAFSAEYSTSNNLPSGLHITRLADAQSEQNQALQSIFSKNGKNQNTFAALNHALWNDGIIIAVDRKANIAPLIHIVHVVSSIQGGIIVTPRTFVHLGNLSQAAILESHLSFSSVSYFTNALTEIAIDEGAQLQYGRAQDEGQEAFHISNTQIWQQKDSQALTFSLTAGGRLIRNNLNMDIEGSGANAILYGLYVVKDHEHVDNHTCVDHQPPNSTSNQLYKGILNDHARAVFNGKIFVRKIAQQTNSYQLNKNLLLGTDCRIDTKPQLEIFADDVKCTHGATIGQLNEEEIFYLRSRSIPKALAVKMLSRGFVDDILNRIENKTIYQKLNGLLSKNFKALQ